MAMASVVTVSETIVSIAPRREWQPPRSDRVTHSDLVSVSCGRLLHVAEQSLCMNAGFFSHSPWSAQETQLELLSILVPAGHSSCRRGTAAGAVEGRCDGSSRCTALSTGGGTRAAARCWLPGCGWPTPSRAPRATALTRRGLHIGHQLTTRRRVLLAVCTARESCTLASSSFKLFLTCP